MAGDMHLQQISCQSVYYNGKLLNDKFYCLEIDCHHVCACRNFDDARCLRALMIPEFFHILASLP